MTEAQEPISLEQAKVHLRLDPSFQDDDGTISNLIADARAFVESETGLVLVSRSITETAVRLGRWIDLRSWPVTAVTTVRYPSAGVLATLPVGNWSMSLRRRPVRLLPLTPGWGVGAFPSCAAVQVPVTLPVEIDLIAGYADVAEIPRNATRAMLLLIAHWYSNRSAGEVGSRAAAIEPPFAVTSLLSKLKIRLV